MTKKQKRAWLRKADLTGCAAHTLFAIPELRKEHMRRLAEIDRAYRLKHKRGGKIERVPPVVNKWAFLYAKAKTNLVLTQL